MSEAPTRRLRVLFVEDREDDAMLVLREIRRGGYEVTHRRVETESAMRAALAEPGWDLVISDYSMPQFSGPAALRVMRETGADQPFIMVSGTVGEETAVEALRAGADDFMVKSRLTRLVPAVERSLRDAEERRARRAAEAELKSMEAQMRQAQKMEAVGRLAGGVAHDFNNILTAILATADLALDTPGISDELRQDLLTIRESGKRAAAITRQLLIFSRKQVPQRRAIDLGELAEQLTPLLRRLLPRRVTLSVQRADRGVLEADPTHIEQVLLNLVVNAGDAMPDGGEVVVSTEDREVTHAVAADAGVLPPGRYVVLRVRDSGVGMDEATRSRIFEPFFTTKDPGKGTGLGLATVYGIVQEAGGQILVHSRPRQGALFEIYFPAGSGPTSGLSPRTAEHQGLGGSEAILLVDDEPSIRAPLTRFLRQLGYFVLEAESGEDALRTMQEYHAPVHLLITDVVMPEMTGAELVGLLHSWYPHLKVLYISGYSQDLLARQGELSPNARYLAKPFTPQRLAQSLRELLDERSASPEAV